MPAGGTVYQYLPAMSVGDRGPIMSFRVHHFLPSVHATPSRWRSEREGVATTAHGRDLAAHNFLLFDPFRQLIRDIFFFEEEEDGVEIPGRAVASVGHSTFLPLRSPSAAPAKGEAAHMKGQWFLFLDYRPWRGSCTWPERSKGQLHISACLSRQRNENKRACASCD